MKADEIIVRQDRVVYTLMILLASIGLVWSFWQHQRHSEIPDSAPAVPTATSAAPRNTVYVQ